MNVYRTGSLRMRDPRTIISRARELRGNVLRMSVPRVKKLRMTGLRMQRPRAKDPRMTVPRIQGSRTTGLRGRELRETGIRAGDPRAAEADRTGPQGKAATRGTGGRKAFPRTETVTTEAGALVRAARDIARKTDRTSPGEAADKMADLREIDRTDFREMAGRALAAVRVIAGVRALVRVLTVISMAVRVTAAAMEDREPDTEIINRARLLRERLLQRIWKRSARKKRGVQTARRRESDPGRIISTRKTKH